MLVMTMSMMISSLDDADDDSHDDADDDSRDDDDDVVIVYLIEDGQGHQNLETSPASQTMLLVGGKCPMVGRGGHPRRHHHFQGLI